MKIYIEYISEDKLSIILSNGRKFVIDSAYLSISKKWKNGEIVTVSTKNSKLPYNYVIFNLRNNESVYAGIPKE